MRRVDAVINWQLRDLCGTTPRRWPLYDKTGAIVAFFGGVSRIRYVDVEGASTTKMDTGNAHSLQPRSIKVRALESFCLFVAAGRGVCRTGRRVRSR